MFSVSTRWNFLKKFQTLFCKISKKKNKTKQNKKQRPDKGIHIPPEIEDNIQRYKRAT